jgi:tRNA threonylcarbamoyladenosine biosynthesis protein TsaB
MVILAVDTTSRAGSLALARDGEVMECSAVEAPNGFGHILYQEIENLLKKRELKISDIDGYAAASGPGSFTGIRVGMTAVKALAEVNGKQAVAVSNLLAMAEAGQGRLRAPVLDARREQVYAAVYDSELRPVVDECVAAWPEFLRLIGDHEVTFLAQSAKLLEAGGMAPLPEATRNANREVILTEPLAAAVARVAARAFQRGEAAPPEAIDANYVRKSDAELKWRDPS